MKRISVTTWSDGCVITRKMGQLQDELMKYQMYAAPREDGQWGIGKLDGDSSVIVAAIELREYLAKLIDKSANANRSVDMIG